MNCIPSEADVENAPKDKRAKEMREFGKNVSVYDKKRNEKRPTGGQKDETTCKTEGEYCNSCDEDLA